MTSRVPTLALLGLLAVSSARADSPIPLGSLHCPAGLDAVKGQRVTLIGIVTGQYSTTRGSHFTVQDATGGVTVFGQPRLCAAIGDSLRVSGTVTVYNGLVEVSGTTETPLAIETLGHGHVPAPVPLTPAQLDASANADGCEPNESRRVTLHGVVIRMADGSAPPTGAKFESGTNYRALVAGSDSSAAGASLRVVDPEGCDGMSGLGGAPIPSGAVDLFGTVSQYLRRDATSGGYQLLLGRREDAIASH